MRPDPRKRAEALSRLDWAPPDEAELQRLYETHRPRVGRLITIGIAVGVVLMMVNAEVIGADLRTLVQLGLGASIVCVSVGGAADDWLIRAAWRPLSRSEVDEAFGFPMAGYGPYANPDTKVTMLLKVSFASACAVVVLLAVVVVLFGAWLIRL
jgi:hypothetical protein